MAYNHFIKTYKFHTIFSILGKSQQRPVISLIYHADGEGVSKQFALTRRRRMGSALEYLIGFFTTSPSPRHSPFLPCSSPDRIVCNSNRLRAGPVPVPALFTQLRAPGRSHPFFNGQPLSVARARGQGPPPMERPPGGHWDPNSGIL